MVRIRVKNVGDDRASDLVARHRPESGLYVSVDESPIPTLVPQEEAELLYKLDVSKDALPGKNYQLKILFQFSDSRRDDLTDWENAYLRIEEGGREWALAILLFLALLAAVLITAVRRRKKGLRVLGRPVSRVEEIYSHIGYMTQHKALYPDLTVEDLGDAGEVHGLAPEPGGDRLRLHPGLQPGGHHPVGNHSFDRDLFIRRANEGKPSGCFRHHPLDGRRRTCSGLVRIQLR